jgi:hypothetical protein
MAHSSTEASRLGNGIQPEGYLPQLFETPASTQFETSTSTQLRTRKSAISEASSSSNYLSRTFSQVTNAIKKTVSDPDKMLRIYNGGIAVLVTADLAHKIYTGKVVSEPEYMYDIITHGFQACISKDSSVVLQSVATALNVGRLGAIAYTVDEHIATIPYKLDIIDIGNHLINTAKNLVVIKSQRDKIKTDKLA